MGKPTKNPEGVRKFTIGEFDWNRIERLEGPFIDRSVLYTLASLFQEHPPAQLQRLDPEELTRLIESLLQRDDVKSAHSILETELNVGTQYLSTVAPIFGLLHRQPGRTLKTQPHRKDYRELEARCDHCSSKVVTAQVDSNSPAHINQINPGNVIYCPDLSKIFTPSLELACVCGNRDLLVLPVAQTTVYRDAADSPELEKRVKRVLQEVAKLARIPAYLLERQIVNGLAPTFTTMSENRRQVDYLSMYWLFEWVKRKNVDLTTLQNFNTSLATQLNRVINERDYVWLPLSIVRTRVKRIERLNEKFLKVLYNIREEGRPDRPCGLVDVYGIRVILPTTQDCYAYLHRLRSLPNFSLVSEPEDFITNIGRVSSYKSIHADVTDGALLFELQIRTHQMDRAAETDPSQKADSSYIPEKRAALEQIPKQVRALVAAVLGTYK